MKAESPGPSVGKLVPKLKQTARLLYVIYFGLTIIQFILLIIAKMPVFDAITLTLGTAGTGGFAIKNTGLGGYTAIQQWIITIFMIVFGVNFNAYYLIILKKFKKAFTMEEVRTYFIIIIVASGIIFSEIYNNTLGIEAALRHSFFQVAAIITTTGYSTVDFDLWSTTAKTVIVLLMFSGACAGSTAGGIKLSRIIIAIKTTFKEMHSYIHPKSIKKINFEGKPVEHEVLRSINVFLITYMLIFGISMLLISTNDLDLTTNFTSVLTSLSNVGPGFNLVGPTKNFGFMNNFTKIILIFDMLAGRLELFPLLMLFHPGLWKGFLSKKN
jgi:trk system potassium uptake protein TrkH